MALKASEVKVGDTYQEEVCDNLSRTQIVQYAGASGDYNPLHSDEIFTTEIAGYPSVFAHGMLSMGMTGRMLTNYVGDGQLIYYGVRFTSQVFPGATLTAKASVTEIRKKMARPLPISMFQLLTQRVSRSSRVRPLQSLPSKLG